MKIKILCLKILEYCRKAKYYLQKVKKNIDIHLIQSLEKLYSHNDGSVQT